MTFAPNPGFLDRFRVKTVTPARDKVAGVKKRAFFSGQFDSMSEQGGTQWTKYPGMMEGWPERDRDEVEKAYEKGRLRGLKAEYGDFYKENPATLDSGGVERLAEALRSGKVKLYKVQAEFERSFNDIAYGRIHDLESATTINRGRLDALRIAGMQLEPRDVVVQDGKLRVVVEPGLNHWQEEFRSKGKIVARATGSGGLPAMPDNWKVWSVVTKPVNGQPKSMNPRKPRMTDEYMNELINFGGVVLPRHEAAAIVQRQYEEPQRRHVLAYSVWGQKAVSGEPWSISGGHVGKEEAVRLLSENPADHYRAGYKRGQEFRVKHGNWSLEGAKHDFDELAGGYFHSKHPEDIHAHSEYRQGLEDGFHGELRKYAAFQWQGGGMYKPESAVGPVFDSETKARRYADKMNETEEARQLPGGGYVVRRANRNNPSIFDYEEAWRAGRERGQQFMERAGVPPSQLHPSEFSQAFNVWWRNERPAGVTGDIAGNRRAFIRGFKEIGRERRTA